MSAFHHYLNTHQIQPKQTLSNLCKPIDTSSSIAETHQATITPIQNKLIRFYDGLQIVQEQPEEQSAIKKITHDEVNPDVRNFIKSFQQKPNHNSNIHFTPNQPIPQSQNDDLQEYDQILQNLKKELLTVGIVLDEHQQAHNQSSNQLHNKSIEFSISPSNQQQESSGIEPNQQNFMISSNYSLDKTNNDEQFNQNNLENDPENYKAQILKLIMDDSTESLKEENLDYHQKLLKMGSMLDQALQQSQLKEKEIDKEEKKKKDKQKDKENIQILDTYQVQSFQDSQFNQKPFNTESFQQKQYTTLQTVQSQQLTSSQLETKTQCLQSSNKQNQNVFSTKLQNSQYFNECRYSIPLKQSVSAATLLPPPPPADDYFDPFSQSNYTCTNQKQKKKIIFLQDPPKIKRDGFQMTNQVKQEFMLKQPSHFKVNVIEKTKESEELSFNFHQMKEIKQFKDCKQEQGLKHPVKFNISVQQGNIGQVEQEFELKKIERELKMMQPNRFDTNLKQKQLEDFEQELQISEIEEITNRYNYENQCPKKEWDENFLQKLVEQVIVDEESIEQLHPINNHKRNNFFLQQVTQNLNRREKEQSVQLFETQSKVKTQSEKSRSSLKRCPSFMERVEIDIQKRQIKKEISQKVKEKLDKEQEREFKDYLRRKEEKVRKRSTSRKTHERLYKEAQNRKDRQERDSVKRQKEKESLQKIVTDRRIMNNVDRVNKECLQFIKYLSLTKKQNAEEIFQSLYQ